ncbi:AAA family ATPase [Methylobacterium sp. J-001]|uniref:AAA family ATPase n=1 Tax=Methylobacterium sp. J-001 TaxID=2836609 RepID=UPI001FBA6C07|nr:AAA family ATPase [Methylobacterium sp. J-001]MCJ2117045.1 AAA family ATPase [Methylobacterium sp. J-001]
MSNDLAGRHHVVLSGCSGGGKSTLLAELARRGFPTVPEPGRRIVEDERRGAGTALPWVDLAAFARRAIEMASRDREETASSTGWVFFDRSLVDAVVALRHATGASIPLESHERYHSKVFLAPPWPDIYVADRERPYDLDGAIAEYDRLFASYGDLGYETILLPKVSVVERADFVLHHLR